MRDLAKAFTLRSLTLQVILVAIIAVALAGLSRHSALLEWAALVATILLVVADPLTRPSKVGATPTAKVKVVEAPAIERKIFTPSRTGKAKPVSEALFASKV
jgi:hypothetical protein